MTKKQARGFDSIIIALVAIAGGAGFGFWQHSVGAGIFAVVLLGAVANIGWSIEYGSLDYEKEE